MTDGFEIMSVETVMAWCRYCTSICLNGVKITMEDVRTFFAPYGSRTRHRMQIQGVSRLVDITAGGDCLVLCDQKSSYKHVSDFGRLRSYDRLKLRREGNDY